MAGNQTHGYDLAIEFSSHFFNQFLGVTLDSPVAGGSGSLLCQLLTGLGHPELCGAFTVDVLMSRPTDLAIPASARDFLDIHIGVADGTVQLRMVVGVVTDRSQPNADIFMLDFQNHLFAQQIKIGGLTIPEAIARPLISSTFKKIPLPSIPLANGRGSTNPGDMIRADTRVIDDTSGANLDAWAILLTFGGGAPGDSNAFSQSFIPSGGNGAVAIYFHWLMRILSPMLASALGMDPTGIVDGHLVSPFLIDSDDDVTLTKLDLTLEDGFIHVGATVTKSGFCYSASGTVSASLKLAIENGKLIVQPHVDDPDIDVDIPWYCWIAGAVIGALLGGVLFGVIGAIVGAVLVPLITWIASEVIEGVVESVTSLVSDAINNLLPDVDVAIPGIDFIFDDVFIDDIVIKATTNVRDWAPIKCSGTALVNNGQYLDLDSGIVQNDDSSGADLFSGGGGFGRYLRTVCRTTLARTGQKQFDGLARFNCFGYTYQLNAVVPLGELAEFDIWGLLWGDKYDEQKYVYAVVTNENRYSLFRVIEVQDGSMRIQYKTFGVPQSLNLTGGFTCGPDWKLTESVAVAFKAAPVLLQTAAERDAALLEAATLQNAAPLPTPSTPSVGTAGADRATLQPVAMRAAGKPADAAPTRSVVGIAGAALDANIGHLGTWMGQFTSLKKDTGRFTAVATGLVAPVSYVWAINGEPLQGASGTVTIDGKRMNWAVAENHLTLTPVDHLTFEFELKVVASDKALTTLSRLKCIKYVPICKVTRRVLPPYKLFNTHYRELWGRAEVPLKNLVLPAAPTGPIIT
jgi:hypothetical protein